MLLPLACCLLALPQPVLDDGDRADVAGALAGGLQVERDVVELLGEPGGQFAVVGQRPRVGGRRNGGSFPGRGR